MIKQITEQLELPLEYIYQLSLAVVKTVKRKAKHVPNIPYMPQIILNFDKSDVRRKYKDKNRWKIAIACIAGIIGGIILTAVMR